MSRSTDNDVKGKDKPKFAGRVSFAPQSTPDETRPLLNDDIERSNEQNGEGDEENGAVHRLHRKSKIGLLLGRVHARRPSYSQLDEEERANLHWRRWLTYAVGWTLLALVVVGVIVAAMLLDKSDHPTGPYPGPPKHSAPPSLTFSIPPSPFPTGLPRNPAYLIKAANGAVATENRLCSEMGVDILKAGGSAVDAVVTSTLCVGTVNMFSSGIGGGGFMTIRPPEGGKAISIDFRETAPSGSNATMFGKDPLTSLFGGLAVGVPGELRGLETAHKMYGKLPWKRVVEPVAELAKGWKMHTELGKRLKWLGFFMLDGAHPEWQAVFAPNGTLLQEGDWIQRTNYSRTLYTIAEDGVDPFYQGDIAVSLVKKIRATGGIMTLEDMAAYKVKVYDSVTGTYRGNKLYTTGAPTSGPVLLYILKMLERFDLPSEGFNALNIHRVVEALKFGFAARTEIGDVAFFPNHTARIAEIANESYGRSQSFKIDEKRTHPAEWYGPVFDIPADHGTTHLSIVDKEGMAVALTTTVNLIFGSQVMDPITGVILNDEMDDFSRPGMPNYFGFPPSPYNYPEGGKRSVSSTAPTIMERPDGTFLMAVGGSGGSRIFPAVAQVILGMDWGWDIGKSVEHARVHDQLYPAEVSIETTFESDLVESLRARGHNISMFDINEERAEIQAVKLEDDGFLYAASDSRKNGVAAGY